MARIVITEFLSLDGVMEDPGDTEDFERGGWKFVISRGADGDEWKLNEILASDGSLIGRITYEGFAGIWPKREDPFAKKMCSVPKFVVSSTLTDPVWENSVVLEGDVGESVAQLKASFDGTILVHGSAQLAQELIDLDLVDEVRLMVWPIVVGAGKRLFGETRALKQFTLVESKVVGDGVLVLTYVPRPSEEARPSGPLAA